VEYSGWGGGGGGGGGGARNTQHTSRSSPFRPSSSVPCGATQKRGARQAPENAIQ
jgi:hypothetical protein